MSYGAAEALQKAIYERLSADAGVTTLVGDAIYDAMPGGRVPDLYLSLGTEEVTVRRDVSASLAKHRVTVSVIADSAGFAPAKALAAAVTDALEGASGELEGNCLMDLRFERARAVRVDRNRKRRIDLRFVALVDVPLQ